MCVPICNIFLQIGMQLHCKCVPICNNVLQIGTVLQIGMRHCFTVLLGNTRHWARVGQMLSMSPNFFQCWANVCDAGPALKQHWVVVMCSLDRTFCAVSISGSDWEEGWLCNILLDGGWHCGDGGNHPTGRGAGTAQDGPGVTYCLKDIRRTGGLFYLLVAMGIKKCFQVWAHAIIRLHPAGEIRARSRYCLTMVLIYQWKQTHLLANTSHWINAVLMLAQRRGRWDNIKTALVQCLVFAALIILHVYMTSNTQIGSYIHAIFIIEYILRGMIFT